MRRCGPIWFLAAALPLAAAKPPAVTLPPLPQWNEEDRKALQAGDLAPGELLFFGEIAGGEEMPPPSAEEVAVPEAKGREVPESFLEAYFAARPEGYLIDPQGLLDAKTAKDRTGFLRYHADDSEIDLYVYVFDGGQDIPAGVRHEELGERFFAEGKPAVAVLYFLGAPQRSLIRISPGLEEVISAAEQQRALASSVAESLEKADALEQFEAFCVQMSIRLYWMERAAGLVKDTVAAGMEVPERKASPEAEEAVPGARERVSEVLSQWAAPVAVLGGTLAVAGLGIGSMRARRRFRFPEFETAPRLGGAHGAGVGAVISFGSTAQSPASQRSEVPDYLAGI